MKKTIVASMLVLTTLSVPAQIQSAPLDVNTTLSAISIVMKVGGWIFKDSKKVYYVQVESTADTREAARHGAYRKAVELAVGAIVVGERESVNDRMVRNDIIVYSSGYVEDYKIISETTIGGKTRMVVDVWVSDSKIANRILTFGKSEGEVNGDAIKRDWDRSQTMAKTAHDRNIDAKKLVKTILNDYPRVAYQTTVGNTFVERNTQTGVIGLHVEVTTKFNSNYANAFGEAIELTSQFSSINQRQPGVTINKGFMSWNRGAWVSGDMKTMVADKFNEPISMEISFYGNDGIISHRNCWDANQDFAGEFYGYDTNNDPRNRGMGFINEWHFRINSSPTVKINYVLEKQSNWGWSDQKFIDVISTFSKVEARVVLKKDCKIGI